MSQANVRKRDPALLRALAERRSVPAPALAAPGPDAQTLRRLLASAVRVPDHGRRVPFRFLRIQSDALPAFGDALARIHAAEDPDASEALLAKDRQRYRHAPLVLVVVAKQAGEAKVPAQEKLLSAGCVCFALLQAAQAEGYGAQWLTGWAAYSPGVARLLGVAADEAIAGFVHVGTVAEEPAERERPDPATLLGDWTPAA
jgi:nitroreductase